MKRLSQEKDLRSDDGSSYAAHDSDAEQPLDPVVAHAVPMAPAATPSLAHSSVPGGCLFENLECENAALDTGVCICEDMDDGQAGVPWHPGHDCARYVDSHRQLLEQSQVLITNAVERLRTVFDTATDGFPDPALEQSVLGSCSSRALLTELLRRLPAATVSSHHLACDIVGTLVCVSYRTVKTVWMRAHQSTGHCP